MRIHHGIASFSSSIDFHPHWLRLLTPDSSRDVTGPKYGHAMEDLVDTPLLILWTYPTPSHKQGGRQKQFEDGTGWLGDVDLSVGLLEPVTRTISNHEYTSCAMLWANFKFKGTGRH
ncbi:hypothetical protein K435DRAFT_870262 [Dendrothele bispora CBS 962.96]|uniref:Uncharacterized protein n=1 Tax=Dendrothele bispora (strain CBS 962.96) TaxID=1314807 RepID=A0A4S8L744_DENBC|nr:hypothetical protein K435DRAFT_870262 [Dendrothele bispora CBS 962.96]